jgi:hypothetical protein
LEIGSAGILLLLLLVVTRIRGLPLTKVEFRARARCHWYPLHWGRGKSFLRTHHGFCGSYWCFEATDLGVRRTIVTVVGTIASQAAIVFVVVKSKAL